MTKYLVSYDELLAQLKKQVGFIHRTCRSYDEGFGDEVARLAVCIRVLVHDTNQSKSLLEHLKVKGKIEYWDSASEYDPANLLAHMGLTCIKSSMNNGKVIGTTYEPGLSGPNASRGRWQTYQWWWNKQLVIVDSKKQKFTRRALVLAAANKDGGAHVDHKLDKDYADLTRFNSLGWTQFKDGVESPFENDVVAPSIRQIAFEMLSLTLTSGRKCLAIK